MFPTIFKPEKSSTLLKAGMHFIKWPVFTSRIGSERDYFCVNKTLKHELVCEKLCPSHIRLIFHWQWRSFNCVFAISEGEFEHRIICVCWFALPAGVPRLSEATLFSVKPLANIGSSRLCFLFRSFCLSCLIKQKNKMHISSRCKISLRHRSLRSSPSPLFTTQTTVTLQRQTPQLLEFLLATSARNKVDEIWGKIQQEVGKRERETVLKDWIQPQKTGGFIGALQMR